MVEIYNCEIFYVFKCLVVNNFNYLVYEVNLIFIFVVLGEWDLLEFEYCIV